jgi:CheY-like chemotaxis protein
VQWCNLVPISDGRDAAKLVESQKFDGIIVADRIPNIDGFELIRQIKDSPLNGGAPIVMLTSDDSIETMRRGFKAGVTFFSSKPPNRDRFFRLFNAVHGAMENERRRHHRLPYRTSVKCALADQEGKGHFIAESIEISEGGMSIKPSGGLTVGQFVDLEFTFPQVNPSAPSYGSRSKKNLFSESGATVTGPQKVRGRIRNLHANGESIGMDFQNLSAGQRQVIQLFIEGNS